MARTEVPAGAVPIQSRRTTASGERETFVGYQYPGGEDVYLRDHRSGDVTRCHKRELVGEAWDDHELIRQLAEKNGWSLDYARQWLREMVDTAAEVEQMLDTCNPPGPGCPDRKDAARASSPSGPRLAA